MMMLLCVTKLFENMELRVDLHDAGCFWCKAFRPDPDASATVPHADSLNPAIIELILSPSHLILCVIKHPPEADRPGPSRSLGGR